MRDDSHQIPLQRSDGRRRCRPRPRVAQADSDSNSNFSVVRSLWLMLSIVSLSLSQQQFVQSYNIPCYSQRTAPSAQQPRSLLFLASTSEEENCRVPSSDDDDSVKSNTPKSFLPSRYAARNKYSSKYNNNNNNQTDPYTFWEEKLSMTSFNMDLHNVAMEDAEKAQDALEIMEGLYKEHPDNPTVVQPDSASYTTVIEGWCYGNHYTNAPHRAQALLDKMEAAEHLEPNELTYLLVCQKWAESYKQDVAGVNAQKAHDILLSSLLPTSNNNNSTTNSKQPSVKLYSIVLEGWCRRVGKVPHAMDRAETLLRQMEDIGGGARPNVLTYTSVIGGLARSKERDLATRADAMLHRMQQHGVEPDMVAYTSLLNCWAKAVSRKERERASTRAHEILAEMEELYVQEENYHTKPNAITYATAIKAIGNSFDPDAPALAEKILWRMHNLTDTGTIHVPPNVGTYNAVITSLSTSGSKSNRMTNARRAEHLLVDMIKRARNKEYAVEPNVRTWGSVLRAWAESGQADSGEQAQRVLDLLESWYDEGKTAVRPNVVCYTTVMSAWARGHASPKVALESVERVLKKMETLYEETLDMDVRPNKISYVTAIDAFGRKCKDKAASRAQATVDRMMRLYALGIGYDRPTRIVFNALINAWSRSNESNAAANAEKIFRWMEAQYRAGDAYVKPDEVTLCGVLNAWANHAQDGGARRAQEILDHTESLSWEDRGFANSIICHNIIIKAWGRSREPEAVQRAEEILIRREEGYRQDKNNVRPDVTTYSSVINCCAYYSGDSDGQQKAFEVALRTFRKLRDTGDGPNNITYGTLFKAVARLTPMDNAREEMVQNLFQQCQTEGLVDSFVLSQVRAASPVALYRKMVLEPSSLNDRDENNMDKILENMPREWGKKVFH
jgi:hypothetical protein